MASKDGVQIIFVRQYLDSTISSMLVHDMELIDPAECWSNVFSCLRGRSRLTNASWACIVA